MAFLNWTTALHIGVQAMDAEHQQLVKLMNDLHQHHETGAPKPVMTAALKALFDYTVKHFKDEEEYMRRIKYDGYKVHCITHQHLVKKLTDFRDAYVSGRSELTQEFFNFLKLWLSAHILQIDKQYTAAAAA